MKTIIISALLVMASFALRAQGPVLLQHISEKQLDAVIGVDTLTGRREPVYSIAGKSQYQLRSAEGDVWLLTQTRAYRFRRKEENPPTISLGSHSITPVWNGGNWRVFPN